MEFFANLAWYELLFIYLVAGGFITVLLCRLFFPPSDIPETDEHEELIK